MMPRAEEIAWLAGLQAGTQVAYGRDTGLVVATITRVTGTQIVCGTDRFNRTSGKKLGSSRFHHTWLHPVTPEIREALERRRLLFTVSHTRWPDLSSDALRAVVAIITPTPVKPE